MQPITIIQLDANSSLFHSMLLWSCSCSQWSSWNKYVRLSRKWQTSIFFNLFLEVSRLILYNHPTPSRVATLAFLKLSEFTKIFSLICCSPSLKSCYPQKLISSSFEVPQCLPWLWISSSLRAYHFNIHIFFPVTTELTCIPTWKHILIKDSICIKHHLTHH